MECRAGTSIFGHSAGVGGGTVRIFCFLGSVLVGAVRLNRWGWRDSTDLSSFPGFVFFGGYGTIEMVGVLIFKFSLSSVSCQFSWRVDMRGRDIVLFFLWYFVVVSCVFSIPVVDC